jgi:hypothetical protein
MNKRLLILLTIFGWSIVAAAQTEAPDTKQKFAEAQGKCGSDATFYLEVPH